ncbi:hypothetical protein DE146DRAFT_735536 [Phaeosphaeria sp. MPI-PUGE-AT-0046c]|nr:hypothetical protein DE146DRAFT_735536 [Phaeosphaeria sp. MPI-PUGE-AT-0046c]
MAIDLGVVGLIGSAIKLSWNVYERGFNKEKSSPQRYIEFGDALHRLYSSLNTIEAIIETARTNLGNERINSFGPTSYDLTSLTEIIGNFRLTLEECRDFLNDDTKFCHKDGFITNILYNINVDPQVMHLTERLNFHNTKIALVLDSFNIHVQTQLRELHKEQHQDIAEHLQELKQLLISSREPIVELTYPRIERDLEVPLALQTKFAANIHVREASNKQSGIPSTPEKGVPVKDGLEAFFYHFNVVSAVTDPMGYLRLMKSIWIMDQIRGSEDWKKIQRTNPGSLYDRCVREMDRRLRVECSRVAANRMPHPQLNMLLQLPDDAFTIWPKALFVSMTPPVAHLGVLLDVAVLPDLETHTLRIVENIDGTLGVEDTTIESSRSSGVFSNDRVVQKLNIDLRRAYLIPIYSMPSNTAGVQPSLTMKLQSSRDGINGITPEFKSMADLFRLQHLITGYRCVKERRMIRVKSLARGQDFPHTKKKGVSWSRKPATDLLEIGNVQLWQKTTFERHSSPNANSNDPNRRPSGASSANPSSSVSLSTSSIVSSMSLAHTQQISLGSSRTAIELKQPEPPRLVLFLKHLESGQLSFLVVELDERTKVEPNSCGCRSSKKTCSISVLERSGTPLLARRYYATSGLNSWNVAAIGEYWSTSDANAVKVRDMYWLRLGFSSEEERVKFNSNVADLTRIFAARMVDFRKDLDVVRRTQILTQAA